MSFKKQIPFIKMKIPFITVSLVFMLASFYFIFVNGLNFGVDFNGGLKLLYKFNSQLLESDIREKLAPLNLGDMEVVKFGSDSETSFLIKVKHQDGNDIVKKITDQLNQSTQAELLSEEAVGPKVGAELRKRGLFAVLLTWVLFLVYIGIRFDFLFAPGAILALVHDITITFGFFAFFNKEVNLPILAAALTIIGYSINDTIIIFDRIRENIKKLSTSLTLEEIVNRSVNETLSRTIVTSLTVLFAVLVLYFLGGGVLKDFAFCLIIGVIFGTYSTIFIASPVYLWFHKFFPNKGMARGISLN